MSLLWDKVSGFFGQRWRDPTRSFSDLGLPAGSLQGGQVASVGEASLAAGLVAGAAGLSGYGLSGWWNKPIANTIGGQLTRGFSRALPWLPVIGVSAWTAWNYPRQWLPVQEAQTKAARGTIDYQFERQKYMAELYQSHWREQQSWYMFKDAAASGSGYSGDPFYEQKAKMYYGLSQGGLPYGSGSQFGGYPGYSRYPAAGLGEGNAGI